MVNKTDIHKEKLVCVLMNKESLTRHTFLLSTSALATVAVIASAKARVLGLTLARTSRPGNGRGLLESGGDNVGGQVQVASEVLDASIREVKVVVSPVKVLANVTAGLERDHHLHDLEVGHANHLVINRNVLGGDNNALLKQVGIDSQTVLLGDQHLFLQKRG